MSLHPNSLGNAGTRRPSFSATSHVSSDHNNNNNNNSEHDETESSMGDRQKSAEPARVPMMEGVTTVGPVSSKCPRMSALGTLRAVGSGQSILVVETKGAGNDSEVAAASRDPFAGTGHTKFILSVAFSPDGTLIASGSGDQLVILWDTKTCARRSALIGHNSGVRCVEFSHDGLFLASASSDHNCILWDCLRGNQRAQLKGHTMEVNTVAFAPDSSFLYSGGVDKTIFVWDLRAPVVQLLTKIPGHTGHIHSISCSPDGNYMLSAGADRQIIVWDTRNDYKQIDTLTKHTRDIHCVAFSVDGSQFATGGADGLIVVWNGSTFSEHTLLKGHTNRVMSVAFSPTGNLLVSASMDKSIGIWDPVKGGLMRGQLKEHGHQVYSVAFPKQGPTSCFVSGSFSSNFIFWEMVRGRVLSTLEGAHTKANVAFVEWVQLPEASHRLLVKSTDAAGEEYLWDAESGRTTQLERVVEQESKLREMDDIRIHQEKMVKLAKQRQEKEKKDELVKKGLLMLTEDGDYVSPDGVPVGEHPGSFTGNRSTNDFGELMNEPSGTMTPGGGNSPYGGQNRLEAMIAQLPEKIANAVSGNSPDSAVRRKLHSTLTAANVHNSNNSNPTNNRSHGGDSASHGGDTNDQQSVFLNDRSSQHQHGGGMNTMQSFSGGGGGGGWGADQQQQRGRRGSMMFHQPHQQPNTNSGQHSRAVSGGIGSSSGGTHNDSAEAMMSVMNSSIHDIREQQRSMQKEVSDLRKDVSSLHSEMKTMTQTMSEMLKLLKKK